MGSYREIIPLIYFLFDFKQHLNKTVTPKYYGIVLSFHILVYLWNEDSYETSTCSCSKLWFSLLGFFKCPSPQHWQLRWDYRSLRRWNGLSKALDFHYSARMWSLSITPTLTCWWINWRVWQGQLLPRVVLTAGFDIRNLSTLPFTRAAGGTVE